MRRAAPLLLLALGGGASRAQAPFAGVPGVVVTRYPVTGTTADAVRRSMNARRPTDPNDGTRVDAITQLRFDWHWRGDRRGKCDLDTLQVKLTARVVLPQLVDRRAPPALRRKWTGFVGALAQHEATHVRHAYERVPVVAAAIRNGSCEGINDRGNAALAQVLAWDRDYDRRTNHGEREGIAFP
jgi:predicted secreted Zn-dependent protease